MYLKTLKNPLFFKLSIVQLLVYFGSFFTSVAIYTMVLNFKATPVQNALIVASFSIPGLFGVINGSLVDKFNLQTFMRVCLVFEMFFTMLFLTISDISQIYLLMIFIILRMSMAFLFFTSQMSLFPQIAKDEEELKTLNELHSIIWSSTYAIGMSLGGVVVNYFGVYNTIKLDIALFVVAIFLFFSIKFNLKQKKKQKLSHLIIGGFRYLKKNPLLLKLMLLHSSVALTSFDTIINLLTDINYKDIIAIPLAIGFLNGTRAFALMIGPLFVSKYVNKLNLHIFLSLQGFIIIIWGFLEKDFYLSLAWMLALGFLTTTLWSYTYTMLQTKTKKEYLGRVVAYNDTIFMSVGIAVSYFSGYFYQIGFSLRSIIITLGVLFILFGYYYYKKLRGIV